MYQQEFLFFVGQENIQLFEDTDVICPAHFNAMRNYNPEVAVENLESRKRKLPATPVVIPRTTLRSGKILPSALIPSSSAPNPLTLQSTPEPVTSSQDPDLEHELDLDQPVSTASLFPQDSIPFPEDPDYQFDDLDGSLFANEPAPYLGNSPNSVIPVLDQQSLSSRSDSQTSDSQHFVPSNSQELISISQTSSITAASVSSSASSIMVFRYIQGVKSTQSKCFVCNGSGTGRRSTVPWSAIQQVWFRSNYYIPQTNRACPHHLMNGLFTSEALDLIEATKQGIHVKTYDFGLWLHEVSDIRHRNPYSFDHTGLEESKYQLWTGLRKEDFDNLATYIKPGMRNSSARTIRDGLAMFLILLRCNLKQEAIGDMFGTSQQVVSKTIDTVTTLLERSFVPNHLGYLHISRDDALENHSRSLTSRAVGQPPESLCVIIDATYIYIEKPSDLEEQRMTYSGHKKRNLVKVQLVVLADGHIVEADGPFCCDSNNNDAAILLHHYENSDLLLFLEEDQDFILWDRGYRDAEAATTEHKILSFMPNLLPKDRQQFNAQEANDSRRVTLSRWVVEAVNGRLKNVFPFFKHTVEGSYNGKIMRFVRIACGILNKYFPSINPHQDFHNLVADAVENHAVNNNELKTEIEELGLRRMTTRWVKADAQSVEDFPRLTWDDLKMKTLGTYQLKIAERYNKEHMKCSADYGILIHRDTPNIIRTQIRSRFSRSTTHSQWLKYDPGVPGLAGILGMYCTCKVGERTLGCCSHSAAV